MTHYILIFAISLSLNSIANSLNDIQIFQDDSAPLQKLMLQHLSKSDIGEQKLSQLISQLELMNKNLAGVDTQNIKAFLFSKFFNEFFDIDKEPKLNIKAHISSSNLNTGQEKLVQYKNLYTEFAYFYVNDLFANFSSLGEGNLLNNYKNKNLKDKISSQQQDKIAKLNKHIGPWIIKFLRLSSKEFNELCTYFILKYFENMASVSHLFNQESMNEKKSSIFWLKQNRKLNSIMKEAAAGMKQDNTAPTEEVKSSAQDVDSLDVTPMDAAGEKVDKLLENLDNSQQ